MGFETLLKDARIWRFGEVPAGTEALPSGYAALDALLPGGGWPVGALTEILPGVEGIGALRLVLPALARLCRAERWLAWIAPPHLPHAPALAAHGVELGRVLVVGPVAGPAERFWALEESLRACSAVLGWLPRAEWRGLRRLQLAAEAGRSFGLLFRPLAASRLGITPGMRLGAAHALGRVEAHIRSESAERRALEALAAWCGQFTSCVSLAPPEGLLLEIGRSLALFRGLETLVQCVRSGVSALGYQAVLAVGLTPHVAVFP